MGDKVPKNSMKIPNRNFSETEKEVDGLESVNEKKVPAEETKRHPKSDKSSQKRIKILIIP